MRRFRQRLEVGLNDLATTHPELVLELVDATLGTQLTYGSNRPVRWRCGCDDHTFEWEATIIGRALYGASCPVASKRAVLEGYNDLATTHPVLADELADAAIGREVAAWSTRRVWWRCNCPDHTHEWEAKVSSRALHGRGCPVQRGGVAVAGLTDLATTHPAIASQLADPSLASRLHSGSRRRVRWRCTCEGHTFEWVTAVDARVRTGGRCPLAANRVVVAGVNDLATTHPELCRELADPTLATSVSGGSGRKVEWTCICQGHRHSWTTAVFKRAVEGQGCPVAAGRVVLSGVNDLATTHPSLAAELVDTEIGTKVSHGSTRTVWWRCSRDPSHVWRANVTNRVYNGADCRACAEFGFSTGKPAVFYVQLHSEERLLKVGIANSPKRLAAFQRWGWRPLLEIRYHEGEIAAGVERAALHHLRSLPQLQTVSAARCRAAGSHALGGHTEMFDADGLNVHGWVDAAPLLLAVRRQLFALDMEAV